MGGRRNDQPRQDRLRRVGEVLEETYRLEGTIDEGGMGVILEATDLKMERTVAVKLLHPRMAARTKTVKRFERELHLAKTLAHPNLIQLFDYGQTESDGLFIVMEYLEGEDLKELLDRRAPLTVGRTCEIALQILDGLAEAHDHDVVHRDLKPSNVFLSERRRGGDHVKLLDFGIAKSIESGQLSVTATGHICGTPMYVPPECAFEDSPGKPGDVYSVGLLILEMLRGERVFDAGNLAKTLTMHVKDPVPMPSDLVGTPLAEVIRRATAKHPDERYADAAAMLEGLDRAAQAVDTDARVDPEDITPVGATVEGDVFPEGGGSHPDLDVLRSDSSAAASQTSRPASDGSAGADDPPARSASADDSAPGPAPTAEMSPPEMQSPTTDTDRPTPTVSPSTDGTPKKRRASTDDIPTQEEDTDAASDGIRPAWFAVGAAAGILLGVGVWIMLSGEIFSSTQTSGSTTAAGSATADAPDQPSGSESTNRDFVSLRVTSKPSGARAFVDGRRVGTTPAEFSLPTDAETVDIRVDKPGFEGNTATVDPSDGQMNYQLELTEKRGDTGTGSSPEAEEAADDERHNAAQQLTGNRAETSPPPSSTTDDAPEDSYREPPQSEDHAEESADTPSARGSAEKPSAGESTAEESDVPPTPPKFDEPAESADSAPSEESGEDKAGEDKDKSFENIADDFSVD
jgi:serine/threonine protein kinase